MDDFIPFCGRAPLPTTWLWTTDIRLIACLAGVLLAYIAVARVPAARLASFIAGWAVLALALVSPLCNISVALFSARVVQHMIFLLVAAPLLAAGLPSAATSSARFLAIACAGFFVALWFWHSPAPYDLTLRDNRVYWLMQASLVGASLALWRALMGAEPFAAFIATTLTGLHMSLLGAILTLAKAPLYRVYAHTTEPWGLAQVQDQNLGGLIMWAPAGLALTAYSILALGRALQRLPATSFNPGRAI